MTALPAAVRALPLANLPHVGEWEYPDDHGATAAAAERLRTAGRRVLGQGSYSVVGTHSRTRVVKLSMGPSDGFRLYHAWVLASKPKLPKRIARHLPRFYASGEVGGVMVYVLERLTEDGYKESESLEEALEIVNSACPPGQRSDVYFGHGSNILCRGYCGVITDPWAHEGE